MGSLFDAVRFLTIVPLPRIFGTSDGNFGRCAIWFPLIGAMVGVILASGDIAFQHIFPPAVSAALVIGLSVVVCGGLHQDGLADSADGLFSTKPPELILTIMKDSRIGAMGTLSLLFVLGLKVVSLGTNPFGGELWRVIFLMPVVGRSVLLFGVAMGKPIVEGQGLGSHFFHSHRRWKTLPAISIPLVAGYALLGVGGIIGVGLAFVCAGLLLFFASKRLGGINGDILGAMCEVSELVWVMTLSATPVMQYTLGGWI